MKNKDIIALEEKLRLAMLTSDVERLNELIADSLIFTAPNGMIINKEMDLNGHRLGIQKLSKLELLEQTFQLYDNFAIVTAKMQIDGTFNEECINGIYCYTRIWANFENKWQIAGGHVSKQS